MISADQAINLESATALAVSDTQLAEMDDGAATAVRLAAINGPSGAHGENSSVTLSSTLVSRMEKFSFASCVCQSVDDGSLSLIISW